MVLLLFAKVRIGLLCGPGVDKKKVLLLIAQGLLTALEQLLFV